MNVEEEEFIRGTHASNVGSPEVLEMETREIVGQIHTNDIVIKDTFDSQLSLGNDQNDTEQLQVSQNLKEDQVEIEDKEPSQTSGDGVRDEGNLDVIGYEKGDIQELIVNTQLDRKI